jgi:phosphoserine phosphatase RsbU/P
MHGSRNGEGSYHPPLRVGVPIGAGGDAGYEQLTERCRWPTAAPLIAFTDGLVERRDEVLDDGLARLRRAAAVWPDR